MKNILHTLILFLVLIIGKIGLAQNIQVVMSPKPSPYISDWQNKTETLKLIITNSSQDDVTVKIKTELFDGNGNTVAVTDAPKMPELIVSRGTSIYNAEDVFPSSAIIYKGKAKESTIKTGRIPEDNYKLCVALTNPKTNEIIGTSGTVCKLFNITSYQAPILLSPSNKQEIKSTQTKGILFRWTPITPRPSGVVAYRLNIWEVLEGQTPMTAIRTNQPIVSKDLKEATQSQWPIEFDQPKAGKEYVWTITPLDQDERKLLDGTGFSEPLRFSIPTSVQAPALLSPSNKQEIESTQSKETVFRWTPVTLGSGKIVTYRMQIWEILKGQTPMKAVGNNKPIVTKDIKGTTQTKWPIELDQPKAGKEYVWTITPLDQDERKLVDGPGFGPVHRFSIAAKSIFICSCSPWPASLGYSVGPIGGPPTSSGNIAQNNTIVVSTNEFVTLAAITPPCLGAPFCSSGSLTYSVIRPNGVPVYQNSATFNSNFLANAPCDSSAVFWIEIKAKCDTFDCPSYRFYIKKICPPNPSCACDSAWGPAKINGITYNCGDQLKVKCNVPINFSSFYNCVPNDPNCNTITKWEVKKGTTVLQTGTSSNSIVGNFTPSTNGLYTLTLTATCNGKPCKPCVFNIVVDDCSQCKCGNWGHLIVNNQFKTCGSTFGMSCNSLVNFSNMFRCSPNDSTCKASVKWKVELGTSLIASGNGTGNINGSFTPTANGTYKVTMSSYCNGKPCKPCVFYIKVSNCPKCKCNRWWGRTSINGGKFKFIKNNSTFKGSCNKPFSFSTSYRCRPNNNNCLANITWKVELNGGIVASGNSTGTVNGNFTPSANGTYKITIDVTCNGVKCKPCIIYVVVKNCPKCDCGKWGKLEINGKPADCGKTYNWKCHSSLNFSTSYYCYPKGNCPAQIKWKVVLGGSTIANGTGTNSLNASFTPNNSGLYQIIIDVTCNGKPCKPCIFFIKVDNCEPKCCKGSKWGKKWMVVNGAYQKLPKCGLSIGTFQPNSTQSFNIKFYCAPGCKGEVRYRVYDAATNMPVGSPTTVLSGNSASINFPSNPGNYYIKIEGLCDGGPCSECNYYFDVVKSTCQVKIDSIVCNEGILTVYSTASWLGQDPLDLLDIEVKDQNGNPIATNPASIPLNNTALGSITGTRPFTFTIPYNYANQQITVVSHICGSSTNSQNCCVAKDKYLAPPCVLCNNCDSTTWSSPNVSQQPSLSQLNINGSVSTTATNPIVKVTAILESFSANPIGSLAPPNPNFEFKSNSNIGGVPVQMPFSLSGSRSNIAISNFSSTNATINYSLKIDNMNSKILQSYRIKLIVFKADGTFCEITLP